ncbi:hypothetical protein BGZ73_002472 [Actinomortierella ambigua]|nr:hypothetical protein BGZ73_002472 [Actinomortierella ambigua]
MTGSPTCQDNSTTGVDSPHRAANNSHRWSALGSGGRFQRYGPNHYGYDIEQERLQQQQQQQQQQYSAMQALPEDDCLLMPQKNESPVVSPLHIRTKQLWYALPKQQPSPSNNDSHSDLLSPTPSTTAALDTSDSAKQSETTNSTESSSCSSPSPLQILETGSETGSPAKGQSDEGTPELDDDEIKRLEERQRHHRAILSGADSAVSLTGDEDLALRLGYTASSSATTATTTSTSVTRSKAMAAVASTLGFLGAATTDPPQYPSTSSAHSLTTGTSYFTASSLSSSSSASSSSSSSSTVPTGKYQQPPPPIHKSRNGSLSRATGAAVWRRPQQAITAIKPVPQQMNQPLHATTTGASLPPAPPQRPSPPPTLTEGDDDVVVDMSNGSGSGVAPSYPPQRLPHPLPTAGGGVGGTSSSGGKTGWERHSPNSAGSSNQHHTGNSIFDFFRGRKSSSIPTHGASGGNGGSSSSKGGGGGAQPTISYPAPIHPHDNDDHFHPDLAPPRPLFIQSSSSSCSSSSSVSSPSSPSTSTSSTVPAMPAPKGRSYSLTFAPLPFSAKTGSSSSPTTAVAMASSSPSIPSSLSSSSSSPPNATPLPFPSTSPTNQPSLAHSAFSKVAAVVGVTVGKRRSSLSSALVLESGLSGGIGAGAGTGAGTGVVPAVAAAGVSESSFLSKKKHSQPTQNMVDTDANTATVTSPIPHPLRNSSTPPYAAAVTAISDTESPPPPPGVLTAEQLDQHAQHVQRLQHTGVVTVPEPVLAYVEQLYRTVRHREMALSLAQQRVAGLQEEVGLVKQAADQEKQVLAEDVRKAKEQMTLMDENFMAWRNKVHNEQLIIQEEYLHERLVKQDRIDQLEEELGDVQDEARRLRERLMVLEYEDDYTGPSQRDGQHQAVSYSEDEEEEDDYDDDHGVGGNDDLEKQQSRRDRPQRQRRRPGLTSQPGPMTMATHKRRSHDFQRLEHRLQAYEQQVTALLKQLEQERADHQQVLIEFRMRMHNKCLKLEEQVQQAKVEALMYTEMMHELAMENEDLRVTTSKSKKAAGGGYAKQQTRKKGSSSWRSFFDFNHEPVDDEDDDEEESEGTYSQSDEKAGRCNDSHMVEISI